MEMAPAARGEEGSGAFLEEMREGEKEAEAPAVAKWEPSVEGYLRFLVDSKLRGRRPDDSVEGHASPVGCEARGGPPGGRSGDPGGGSLTADGRRNECINHSVVYEAPLPISRLVLKLADKAQMGLNTVAAAFYAFPVISVLTVRLFYVLWHSGQPASKPRTTGLRCLIVLGSGLISMLPGCIPRSVCCAGTLFCPILVAA